MSYTVNIKDNDKQGMERAKSDGFHAYHASGVTAIEIKTDTVVRARAIAAKYGIVLYAFE
jgi:hypothetical protein